MCTKHDGRFYIKYSVRHSLFNKELRIFLGMLRHEQSVCHNKVRFRGERKLFLFVICAASSGSQLCGMCLIITLLVTGFE
jgi:hypothetical protein